MKNVKIKNNELLLFLIFLTPFFTHYLYSYLFNSLFLEDIGELSFTSLMSLLIYAPLIYFFCRKNIKLYIFILCFHFLISTLELFYILLYESSVNISTFCIIFETFDNIFVKVFYSYSKYSNEAKKFESVTQKKDSDMEEVSFNKKTDGNEIYILIIGESASRTHMSLYGYFRKTTPELDSISKELFIFNNVISSGTTTIPTVNKIVTFNNPENNEDSFKHKNIIQFFKKAGFKTYWISNHTPYGKYDSYIITMTAKVSDQVFWVNMNKDFFTGKSFDDKVFYPLNKIFSDKYEKKFIIIHLLGMHASYSKRYPGDYAVFNENRKEHTDIQNEKINTYDNAVLYNDYIVSEIIKMVKKQDSSSFVLYLSDHGEDVFDEADFAGHSDGHLTRYMLEIPFVLWVSEKYKNFNKDKVEQFKDLLSRSYMTDDVMHTIFDLCNIDCKSYNPEKSIISKNFISKKRIINTIDYDRNLTIKNKLAKAVIK
ncbi:sulfatase-like hydrolase/transferase [Candidatus Desantisbacteria bacterium]|nr:sulfatase-like hydrolase/transferase [Candidatus Desantisbacteria bacterium]